MRDAEIREPAGGVQHGVEVEHRLAHPHEHAVVDRLDPAEVERLIEDLRGSQVAPETHLPGRAERARQGAARLRRETDGAAAVAVPHQNRLDRLAVRRAEQRLHCAVARLRLALELERRERDARCQLGSESGGDVRHRLVPGYAAGRPLPDLPSPVGRLAALGEFVLEEGEIHELHASGPRRPGVGGRTQPRGRRARRPASAWRWEDRHRIDPNRFNLGHGLRDSVVREGGGTLPHPGWGRGRGRGAYPGQGNRAVVRLLVDDRPSLRHRDEAVGGDARGHGGRRRR